jgi:hypothetical protein
MGAGSAARSAAITVSAFAAAAGPAPVPAAELSLPPTAVITAEAGAGETLWLGVGTTDPERDLPVGLVRYDRRRGTAHVFRGTDSGPCGFEVRGLGLRGGALWVSTDLGVSRFRVADDWDEWTHFVRGEGGVLEETACATLLAEALESAADPERVARLTAAFRPRFWARWRRARSVQARREGRTVR